MDIMRVMGDEAASLWVGWEGGSVVVWVVVPSMATSLLSPSRIELLPDRIPVVPWWGVVVLPTVAGVGLIDTDPLKE